MRLKGDKKMRFSLEEKIINEVLGYLGKQKYEEVFSLIAGIQSDAKIVKEDSKEEILEEE